jgi:YHYH protein/Fibronectin type III domain
LAVADVHRGVIVITPLRNVRSRSSRAHSGPVSLTLLASLVLTACGGDDSATVPGAPTIGAATAGDAGASIAFTAPSSDGGATITGYTATCTGGTAAVTGTATASPVSVSGLTNGTAYSCSVTAANSAGTGAASGSVSVTPVAATASGTAGVECSYRYDAFNSSASVNLQSTASWSCDTTSRVLAGNGVPDHEVGTFPNDGNPNTIAALTVAATYTLAPTYSGTATTLGGPAGAVGYILNSVKIDAGTAGSCDDTGTVCSLIDNSGTWSIEALGQTAFNFGTDSNNAHVQPTGDYHYHGMPEGFITKQGGSSSKMTLIGWAADGFPIYARYGYTVATDASSALKVITGSYQLVTTASTTRPSTTTYALGTFKQDWEYVAGSGDLDECNGRTGVTPEFPSGIYHYYATDTYPYLQRCVKGTVTTTGGTPPGG